jgi:hypothetical protein
VSILFAFLFLTAQPSVDQHAQLQEARHRFEQGDYKAATSLLRPLIDLDVFSDAADRNEALRLYGVASFLDGRRGDAEGAFTALLAHDSEARLEAALYPPEVVSFFDAIRARREAELARTARRARKHFLLTLVPFGVGQFQNQQPRKGWLLLGGEALLLSTATITFLVLHEGEQQGHTFSDTDTARTLQRINLVSGTSFAVLAALGVVDAIYYYRKDGERSPPPHGRAALLPLPEGGLLATAGWGF